MGELIDLNEYRVKDLNCPKFPDMMTRMWEYHKERIERLFGAETRALLTLVKDDYDSS